MNLQGKILRPLIPFDMIFSMDIGIIKFLQRSCVDNDLFNLEELKRLSDREILSLIQSRKTINPLSILSINGNIDDIYNQLMHDYEYEIINQSPVTDFAYVVWMYANKQQDAIDPYIRISCDEHINKIKSSMNLDINTIHVIKGNNIDVQGDFDPIYINTYADLYHPSISESFRDKFVGKNIYLANNWLNKNYIENIEPDKISKNNTFTLIDLWRKVEFNHDESNL